MRNKAILVFFIALSAVILTLTAVSAGTTCANFTNIDRIDINGVTTSNGVTYVGRVSDTIPIEVQFTALQDVNDLVKVKASIEGYKDDIEQYVVLNSPLQANVSGYDARLSLKLPSSMDLSDLSEDTTLHVEIYTKDNDCEIVRDIRMEKDLYSLNILSLDAPDKVTPGSTVEIDAVVQNNGNQRLDNAYVKASIPELGATGNVFLGDLNSVEQSSYTDIRDSVDRKLYLTIPANAAPGTYNIQVEAYNYDTSTTAKKQIEVVGLESGVMPGGTNSMTVAPGQQTTFNLVVVNPNSRMIVYTITPEAAPGLTINVDQPVVAVPAGSSMTVKVNVQATSSATEGAHLVTVDVNSDTGLVKQVSYNVNVVSSSGTTNSGTGTTGSAVNNGSTGTSTVFATNGVLILTVILVIIFVVLLVVLIVLLTRKPATETEEFGETSYY